jgi:hypothetical protein
LSGNLTRLPNKVQRAVVGATEFAATKGQGYAKANAKWTDQTGNARQGLRAIPIHETGRSTIVITHGVPYGIWLEVRFSGRYAIIGPTLIYSGDIAMRLLTGPIRWGYQGDMSRIFVQALLEADAGLTSPGTLGALGLPASSIFAAEAADDIQHFPFLAVRWGLTSRGVGSVTRQLFDVWCHNRDHDFLLIDKILLRIRNLFANVQAAHAVDGYVTQIDWQGDGPDAHDDGYATVTRNSTYLLIGSTR